QVVRAASAWVRTVTVRIMCRRTSWDADRGDGAPTRHLDRTVPLRQQPAAIRMRLTCGVPCLRIWCEALARDLRIPVDEGAMRVVAPRPHVQGIERIETVAIRTAVIREHL